MTTSCENKWLHTQENCGWFRRKFNYYVMKRDMAFTFCSHSQSSSDKVSRLFHRTEIFEVGICNSQPSWNSFMLISIRSSFITHLPLHYQSSTYIAVICEWMGKYVQRLRSKIKGCFLTPCQKFILFPASGSSVFTAYLFLTASVNLLTQQTPSMQEVQPQRASHDRFPIVRWANFAPHLLYGLGSESLQAQLLKSSKHKSMFISVMYHNFFGQQMCNDFC